MSNDDRREGGFASDPARPQPVTRTWYRPNALMFWGEQNEARLSSTTS